MKLRPVALELLSPGDTFIHGGEVWEVRRPPVVSTRSKRVSVLCVRSDGSLEHAIGPAGYTVQPIHRAESE